MPQLPTDDAFAEVKAKLDLVKIVGEHLRLTKRNKERSDSRRRLLEMLKLAAQYYEYVLWSNPAGEPGRKLLESRKVTEETARRFQLGFAPPGRGFAEYLRAKKKSLQDAQDAGLMRRDGSDFFAERLVIPIRDERGQPLAFTARTVRADEQRKYINSPETPAYIKGRVIFGLDLARDEITKRGHAVLMEGQFDVITAHHHGVTNAVASSGTALTDDQVRLLKRFTDELLLVFDADRAGRAAAFKAIELASGHQMRTRVATVTAPAKDPDEFLRAAGAQAAEKWGELEAAAPSGWEFWIKDSLTGLNPGNPNQLELAASRAREVLEKIPDAAVRDTYRERAAGWIGVQPHLLSSLSPSGERVRERGREAQTNGKGGLAARLVGKKLTVG